MKLKVSVKLFSLIAKLIRFADLANQVEACWRVFASNTQWTVVRGSDLEEGESQGLPVWSRHVGDPLLQSNVTRRVDFALFMIEAFESDELIHEAPAIVGCSTTSALAHKRTVSNTVMVQHDLNLNTVATFLVHNHSYSNRFRLTDNLMPF